MPEIQCLSIFPAILTLSRSTDINVHLPTYVGTDDGISGSIMLVPTGREYEKSQDIANAGTQYYLKLKTCTLALCRPDKTRQRRIWHKQSALCWSVPLTLTLSPGGARGLSGHIFRLCHQSEPAIGRLWCPFTLPC